MITDDEIEWRLKLSAWFMLCVPHNRAETLLNTPWGQYLVKIHEDHHCCDCHTVTASTITKIIHLWYQPLSSFQERVLSTRMPHEFSISRLISRVWEGASASPGPFSSQQKVLWLLLVYCMTRTAPSRALQSGLHYHWSTLRFTHHLSCSHTSRGKRPNNLF